MNLKICRIALASCMMVVAAPLVHAATPVEQAQSMVAKGDLQGALTVLDDYLKTSPKDADARFTRGLVLTKLGRTDDAIAVFSALTKDYPQLPEPYNNLAVLYAQKGQYDKARDALEAALATHPSYATASENLGDVYAALAGVAYNRALMLDKNNQQIRYKLSLINKLSAPAGKTQVANEAAPKPPPTEDHAAQAAAPAAKSEAPENSEAAAAPASPAIDKAAITAAVEGWAAAWSKQDVNAYFSHYAKDFNPGDGQSYAAWKKERTARVKGPKFIKVKLSDIQINTLDAKRVRVRFKQDYHSNLLSSVVTKGLELEDAGGRWKILRENVR